MQMRPGTLLCPGDRHASIDAPTASIDADNGMVRG
jgi:hypothetical protein